MQRKYTNYENMKFKKKVSNFKWIANTFLAGAVSGAITLGVMQGCKEKPKEKPNLETKVVQENVKDVNEFSEDYIINYTANRVGVDVDLLKAIRKAENGRAGFEFGILYTEDYKNDKGIIENGKFRAYKNECEKQASWSAWTIKKNLQRYGNYDDKFIDFLHRKYAPIGVENDPKGLNKNWARNVRYFYEKFKEN